MMPWHIKRLSYLLRRIHGSVAQRGLNGTLKRIAQEFHTRETASPEWRLEPLEQPRAAFTLPGNASPRVSVIIPVHGKVTYTLACLRSIARHGAAASFEVIVVDDGSPDDTQAALAAASGLRLLKNETNLGFIGSCNAGAKIARGEYLLFLNNDTQVTQGWLDHLLQCFNEESGCGIVGSRLVYPDGRLQEAGGIVFDDATTWNVGRFQDRDDPRFLHRRDVDYVSGAALMIETTLFSDIGGFDTHFAPAYYEDVDLAFAARARGRRVIYQPESLVVHYEGISSGNDPFTGTKRYQLLNRVKFQKKWHAQLARQPSPKTAVEDAALEPGKQHMLIVDALTPDPTRDSGSLRLINVMRLLRELGWQVTFMADNRRATREEVSLLGRLGVQVLCKPRSPTLARWLSRHGSSLNAVLLCRHYVAEPHLGLVRRLAPRAKIIFDTVDLHFLREQRAAEHTSNAALARQAEASRQRELSLIYACDTTFVVSPVEHKLLRELLPSASIDLLSNVHEVFERERGFSERSGMVFVGGFGHPPNVDAVNWLVHEIYPAIRSLRPDILLNLIGDIPEDQRQSLSQPGVNILGRVDDLTPWMECSRLAIAPLRYGAGVKGKVNMAMSYGLPVVATPTAAEGMNLVDGDNILIGTDSAELVSAVLRLYDDEVLWSRLSEGGQQNVRQYFSFDTARAALRNALD